MPNLVNLIISIFFGLIYYTASQKQQNKKIYLFIVWVCLTFVAGSRGIYALEDTDSYFWTYSFIGGKPLNSLFGRRQNDFMYYLLNWILAKIGVPWQIYLFLVSAFVFGSFCSFIYRYSDDIVVSVVVFQVLFLNAWQMVLRQDIAMAILLFAYEQLRENKKKNAIILYFVASGFHATALLWILFPLVCKIRFNQKAIIIAAVTICSAYVLKNKLLILVNLIGKLLNRNLYEEFYQTNPITFLITSLIMMAVSLIVWRTAIKNDSKSSDYYYGMFLMIMFTALGGGAMLRLAWYFGIYLCLLLPKVCICTKQNKLTGLIMIAVMFIMHLINFNPEVWYFFWEKT